MLCVLSDRKSDIKQWTFTVATDSFQQPNDYDCSPIVALNVTGFLQHNNDPVFETPNQRDHVREVLDNPSKAAQIKISALRKVHFCAQFLVRIIYEASSYFHKTSNV